MEFKEIIKVTENVKRVSLSAGIADVVVKRGDKVEIELSGKQAAGVRPTIVANVIEDKLGASICPTYNLVIGRRPLITLTVPKLEDLDIKTEGYIQVKDGVEADNLLVWGAENYITVEVLATSINARTISGNVMVFSNAEDMWIQTVDGNITIFPESECDAKIRTNSVNGNIIIDATHNENRYGKVIAQLRSTSGEIKENPETDNARDSVLNVLASTVIGNITIN